MMCFTFDILSQNTLLRFCMLKAFFITEKKLLPQNEKEKIEVS